MKRTWWLLCFLFLTKTLFANEIIFFPNALFPFSSFSPSSLLSTDEGEDPFDGGRVSSPPKEYFSINTVYLRNKHLVHIGKDLINGNYVIMPSPNVISVAPRPNGMKAVTIQQYFPDLEEKLMNTYGLTPSQIHHLYITSYRVIDQYGEEIETIYIPNNVHYRPPVNLTFDVKENVKVLSFIFSFTSRTAWADSGIGSDLTSIYKDLREMNIDRDARMFLKIDPEHSSEIYEVFNSKESQQINQILSELHQVVVWGDIPNQEEIINELLDLKTFQFISLDLKNLAADLAKYPHLFGNPTDPRWLSKFEKLSAEKFREEEINNESSGSLSLGVADLFDFGGSGSNKSHNRLKEVFTFEMEGEFYVPKAINFALRADNSLTLMKTLAFQAYKNLEEKDYYLGIGTQVTESDEASVSFTAGETSDWLNRYDHPVDFSCKEDQFMSSIKSKHSNRAEDRSFGFGCSEGKLYDNIIKTQACEKTKHVNTYDKLVKFSCEGDKFMTGERSQHHSSPEDRIFAYTCCDMKHPYVNLKADMCSWSPWVNGFDATFHFKCPKDTIMKGVESQHRNGIEDRRFKFQCCNVAESR